MVKKVKRKERGDEWQRMRRTVETAASREHTKTSLHTEITHEHKRLGFDVSRNILQYYILNIYVYTYKRSRQMTSYFCAQYNLLRNFIL